MLLALILFILDQASKWAVQEVLVLDDSVPVTSFFNLVHVLNPGAAFSFLADESGWQRWLFAALAMGVILVMGGLIYRTPHLRLFCLAASLIIAGAAGNLVDRLTIGAVVDFIDLHWAGWHWPAFNVADIAISVGAGLLILDEILRARGRSAA